MRGAGGGYQFGGNARRTTLLDVIELFESLSSDDTHSVASEPTPEGRALQTVLDEIDDIVRATLGSITISTMVKLADRLRIERTGSAAAGR
jgi:DNA-binding IscR family transcriptional regulator